MEIHYSISEKTRSNVNKSMMTEIKTSILEADEFMDSISSSSFILDYIHEIRDIFDLPNIDMSVSKEYSGRRRNVGQSSGIILQFTFANLNDDIINTLSKNISNIVDKIEYVVGHNLYLGVTPEKYSLQHGIFSLNVFFKGYRQYYQNESRKNFKISLPAKINKNVDKPIISSKTFSLLKKDTIMNAAMGIHYEYFFELGSIEMEHVVDIISQYCYKNAKWNSFDILCLVPIGD